MINSLPDGDVLLCQITSKSGKDKFSIAIDANDFASGSLPVDSNIRPNKLFTADRKIILRKAGFLKQHKVSAIIEAIVNIVMK